MIVFPNILAKNENFKKLRHGFVNERAIITMTLISSCHWNPFKFLLPKEKTWKRIFNTDSELSLNRTEKQFMPFKTTVNWLFGDIWLVVIYSLIVLIEKSTFFNKQWWGFIISLISWRLSVKHEMGNSVTEWG